MTEGESMAVFIDPAGSGDEIRQKIYSGNLVVLTRLAAVQELVDHTRDELRRLFSPHDPETAHEHFDKAVMAEMLGVWKPAFIHSPMSTKLVCAIIEEAGFVPAETHFDLPKPRTAFPVGHLNTGIAFAFPWHRDAWYSAPAQQINWWLPVLAAQEDNSMSFDLTAFARAVPNTSDLFDYYRNNTARRTTASQVDSEQQVRPGAVDYQPVDDQVVLPSPGQVLVFSGAQLHTSTPNTSAVSRYSVDFRTVHVPDVLAGRGAPLVDAHCAGTSIRDFHSVTDGRAFDEDLVRRIYGMPPEDAELVFTPDGQED
jgi:hypothetical protein